MYLYISKAILSKAHYPSNTKFVRLTNCLIEADDNFAVVVSK